MPSPVSADHAHTNSTPVAATATGAAIANTNTTATAIPMPPASANTGAVVPSAASAPVSNGESCLREKLKLNHSSRFVNFGLAVMIFLLIGALASMVLLMREERNAVCMTPGCIHTGGSIIYYTSP